MDFFNLLEKNENLTISQKIVSYSEEVKRQFTLKELYSVFSDIPKHSIRARLYSELKGEFKRLGKGVYISINHETNCRTLVVEGDGRDLSMIPENSIDAIVTDHPWLDTKSHKGGNRTFAKNIESGDFYDSFKYTKKDFEEKFRVLKSGGFLVENLPEENANNFEYIYELKKMALEAGFSYYCSVPWKKGNFVSNTGRKSKNSEILCFFTKGKARNLRTDKKKELAGHGPSFMSGTSFMLPTCFNFQPPSRTTKIHDSEKPIELYESIIKATTREGEIVLDQFGGSLNCSKAANKTGRHSIVFEANNNYINANTEKMNLIKVS